MTIGGKVTRTGIRALIVGGLALLLLVVGLPGVAAAHVTVVSTEIKPGGRAVLTFRVPVESDTANTTALTVNLPAESGFTSVLVEPVPGWNTTTETAKLAAPQQGNHGQEVQTRVSAVTWTATAGGLTPGQFGEFTIIVAPVPQSGRLFFPAVQRYSDGSVVNWVQQAQGDAEPDYPAPSIDVPVASADPGAGSSSSATAWWGVALGALGLAAAVGAWVWVGWQRRSVGADRADTARAATEADD